MNLEFASWQALALTFQLAFVTTLVLFVVSLPLAWWLSRSRSRIKPVIEALIALPLVLPPTVLGFYLLLAIGANGWLGEIWLATFDHQLAFSFTGLVIGSVVYSLPFVIQPLQASFGAINTAWIETAATLGAGAWDRFYSVILPTARNGLLTAAVLGFAHTLGEFGVVLMIGGNIPGETQVASIVIYEQVESLQYAQAHWLSAVLLGISFLLLLTLFVVNRQHRVRFLGAGDD